MTNTQAITLRAKKLGVLLRDARLAAGKSQKVCGEAIGVSGGTIGSFELGKKSPSLPELEILTFYLNFPLEHFWGDELKSTSPGPSANLPVKQLLDLRTGIIGALLRQARTESRLTLKVLSEKTGVTTGAIKKYERGDDPIPLPVLEVLSKALGYTLQDFANHKGPVSQWIIQQRAIQGFLQLPEELIEFVGKPVNHPYIELAKKLSGMSAEKIRSVAETLLEISL
jgi:transcriptional regulator with XRE-family HTH domain